MSNNKIYTEEQMHTVVRHALGRHGIYIPSNHYQDLIDFLTPIELPSDEEIEQDAHIQFPVNSQPIGRTLLGGHYDVDINYSERNAYILSAKNLINKIKGGNK